MAVTPSGKDKLERYMRAYVDELDLSGYSRAIGSLDASVSEVDRTSWADAHMNYKGDEQLIKGARGYRTIMDDDAAGAFENMKAQPDGVATFAFGGGGEPAIGDPAYLIRTKIISLQANLDGGLMVIDGDLIPDAGQYADAAAFPFGRIHQGPTTLSATQSAGSSRSVDWERTDIVDGGWANLHILESDGGTWAFKLQHSSDDSAFSDITGGAFSLDGSVVGSETIEFSGSINQYTAFVATRTSGTVKVLVAVALNIPYQEV